jgi:hypothetical protein
MAFAASAAQPKLSFCDGRDYIGFHTYLIDTFTYRDRTGAELPRELFEGYRRANPDL